MITRVLVFTRQEKLEITTIAIVKLSFARDLPSKEALEHLQEAVSDWIKNTTEGRRAYQYSGGDLNIGDLGSYEVSFRKWLRLSKLTLRDFEITYLGEPSEGTVPFDYHLMKDTEEEVA